MQGPIYRPKGKAAEYSHLALNHYTGCGHECVYCYIRTRYGVNIEPKPVKDILKRLIKQAPQFAGTKERVLLSFNSDPYQPLNQKKQLTREVIQILRQNHIPFQVLTKSHDAIWNFDLYGRLDAFGVTLTFLDKRWKEWEPKASEPALRMVTLQQAKQLGIETWVSLEPVIDPDQSLKIIEETQDFVDLYKIGILNYVTPPNLIDWRAFGREAIALCEVLAKPYWIKSDLAQHLGGISFINTDNRRCDWREK